MKEWRCNSCGRTIMSHQYPAICSASECSNKVHFTLVGAVLEGMGGGIAPKVNPVKPDIATRSDFHYKSHASGVECIDITRHFNFNKGNAIKFIWRSGQKGEEIEDLKKAVWYLNDEIKALELKSEV